MFSRNLIACVFVFFSLSLQVRAHAAIAPALGVSGTPVRSDVQRPRNNAECGKVNVAENIDTSTPIAAAADGSVAATITNFNRGVDGSREVATALVDPTGTGNSFVAATVTQNGDRSPTDVGSQPLTVQLPAGTTCTGGTAGNLCLMSLTTAGKFGNCVVVQQGATTAASTGSANATSTDSATSTNSTTSTDSTAGSVNAGNSTTTAINSTSTDGTTSTDSTAGSVDAGNSTTTATNSTSTDSTTGSVNVGNSTTTAINSTSTDGTTSSDSTAGSVNAGNSSTTATDPTSTDGTTSTDSSATDSTATDSTAADSTATDSTTGTTTTKTGGKKAKAASAKAKALLDVRAVGSRAARALRASLEEWM
ncbi:hypothetical protein A0H81_12584 [Grifola frondosa]|uniref:Uncharacterized protein n=1 Tax=Grifola frondosa TaxID=5627 RepID=A0A1C7LRR1_GRIFR|nr:hypothetical protein A0H81_12584 [Grifola frondosa]